MNDASVGTYNYGGSTPGLAVIFSGVFNAVSSPDGQELRVKDAQGNVVLRCRYFDQAGPLTRVHFDSRISPQAGTYTVEVDLPGGGTFTKVVQVNPSQILPQPGSVNLTATQNTATITWNPVQGAQSYFAEIWQVDNNGNLLTFVAGQYTTGTSMQFSTLDLAPEQAYRARVFAFNADATRRPTTVPAQFSISQRLSSAFTVTSLGTLQLLDLPQGDGVDGGGQH